MVRIITQNVRGLNNFDKRKSLFYYLREKADILCLQEVHSDPEKCNIKQWENEWGGKCFWSHGSSASHGVAILIRKNCNIEIKDSFTDSNGRVIGIVYDEQGESFILLNIYAPNNDDPEYFLEVFRMIENHQGHRIIVGDYNLVLNSQYDRSEGSTEKHEKSVEILQSYIDETLLTDIWRDRNVDKKMYTFMRKAPGSRKLIGSCLDFFLIDTDMSAWVENIKIFPRYKTDHCAVRIDINVFNSVRGRNYWKFYNRVLHEIEFIELIKKELDLLIKQKNIAQDPQQVWEAAKICIVSNAQEYCRERAANRNLVINQLRIM